MSVERTPSLWPRAAWAVLFALLAALGLAGGARAQANEPAPAAAAAEPERIPEDKWNRGTPRGAMEGFLDAARARRWDDAAHYLELSASDEKDGQALARRLKFVLDRERWVDLDKVSDHPAGDTQDRLPPQRELIGTIELEGADFPVYLERVARPDGALVWLISAQTVARVPSAYDALGVPVIVDRLPEVFTHWSFLDVALWQWIGLVLLVLASWIVGLGLAAIFARVLEPAAKRSATDFDDRLLALMRGPARLLVAVGAFNAGLHLLRLPIRTESFARGASTFLLIGGVAWALMRLTDLIGASLQDRLTSREQHGATYLVPIGGRALKVAIVLVTLLATLATWGFDVTAVLAGLGIGGLAVALAAQKTVENVFGGIAVLLDQPVRPGDLCKFGDRMGTVEDIGLRSTRVRTPDRTVVSVPNADFSAMQIENFEKRDRIRLLVTLGLRYETSPDQLRHVMSELRRVLLSHPRMAPDPVRVRFVAFGASTLDVEVFGYVMTTDFEEFAAVREDVYLRFLDVISASGTGFAFPSQTSYQAVDRGIDVARQRAAEQAVAAARAQGKLPFPAFAPEEVRAMDDTLDWPPKGSSAATKR